MRDREGGAREEPLIYRFRTFYTAKPVVRFFSFSSSLRYFSSLGVRRRKGVVGRGNGKGGEGGTAGN